MYIKKIKTIVLFLLIITMLVLTGSPFFAAASNTETGPLPSPYDIISSLMGKAGGADARMIDASFFEKPFEGSLLAFENDNYVFLFEKDSMNMKTILLKERPKDRMFPPITSEEFAIKCAESLAAKVSPGFFSSGYDTLCRTFGEDEGQGFISVELREQKEFNMYTGNNIAVIFTIDGDLDSYVSRRDNAKQTSPPPEGDPIPEAEAIEIAYKALVGQVEELERNGTHVTDTGETWVYDIMLEKRETQTVEARQIVAGGALRWEITVWGVETNAAWGDIGLVVVMDAYTGAVDFTSFTR